MVGNGTECLLSKTKVRTTAWVNDSFWWADGEQQNGWTNKWGAPGGGKGRSFCDVFGTGFYWSGERSSQVGHVGLGAKQLD